jgi:hypothetical protein
MYIYPLISYQLKLDDMRILNMIYVYVQFVTQMHEIGDEYHYFSHCIVTKLQKVRKTARKFFKELVDYNCKFSSLGTNNLFLYCVSMNDKNIINSTAKYIYEIMNIFWDLACISSSSSLTCPCLNFVIVVILLLLCSIMLFLYSL